MPLLDTFHIKRFWSSYLSLENGQYQNWEETCKKQRARFKLLMNTCKNNLYYKDLTKDVKSIEDLQKIPILNREIIQNNALITNNMQRKRIRNDSTSGSTGQPLRFAKDQLLGEPIKIATEMLFNNWVGLKFGERHAQLWGFHKKSLFGNFWHRYIYHCRQFPPYYDKIKEFEEIFYEINKFKPRILTGYSSALYLAATMLKQTNTELKFSLRGIIASAEALLPSQKSIIEEAFQAPVFMRYGAREVDNVGMECSEKNGYHYVVNRFILETVDSNGELVGPGEEGRLLITDLYNHVMPFIRYEIGDNAVLSDELCSCGRTWPLIKEIKGRTSDFLKLPSGKIFPFLSINVIFEHAGDMIREFQVIQKKKDLWVIKIIKGQNFTKKGLENIKNVLLNETNNEIEIKFEVEDKIERTSSGKARYIISLAKSLSFQSPTISLKFNDLPKTHHYLVHPIMKILGRKFPQIYNDLLKSETYSEDQIKSLQLKKLQKLLEHSYQNIPRIRDIMDTKGLTFDDFKTLDDIQKLPLTSKQILRELKPNYVTDQSRKLSQLFRDSTSGSTGEPFIFYKDKIKKDHIEAYKIRNFRWIGSKYGKKYYSIWGFTPHLKFTSKFFRLFVTRRKWLRADASEKELRKYLVRLEKDSNAVLEGYTSAVVKLARLVLEIGMKIELVAVIIGAETLSKPHRQLIEKAFNCDVFNRYGSREFGDIAIESRFHYGLHVYDESFIIEIIDKNGNPCKLGEVGELVITDLDNYAMPFFRYRTGDLSRKLEKKYTQGSLNAYTLIDEPFGRMVDYIQVKDKIISFGFLVLTFEDYPQIQQFQLEQISNEKLILKIVKGTNYSEKVMEMLYKRVQDYCYPLKVKLEFTNYIEPEKSGKFRIVKSLRPLEDIEKLNM